MLDQHQRCIEKGKIQEIRKDTDMVSNELIEAGYDLDASEKSLAEKNFKWAVIQAHYSIQHSFRALLLSKGLNVKGHRCLISEIKLLFVDNMMLDEIFLKDFDYSSKVWKGEESEVFSSKEDFAMYIFNSAGEILEAAHSLTEGSVPAGF